MDFPISFPKSELINCPSAYTSGISYHLTQISSALLLLIGHDKHVDSFISNISLGSSQGWYFRLTQFETVIFSLIMLQMVVLRYLEILPININNIFANDPTGRRRRRAANNNVICSEDKLAESVFRILRKLDENDCISLTLCELQLQMETSTWGKHLPKDTKLLLNALHMSGKRRRQLGNCQSLSAMTTYESAVQLQSNRRYANSTECLERYHGCSLTKDDIIHYVNVLITADFII